MDQARSSVFIGENCTWNLHFVANQSSFAAPREDTPLWSWFKKAHRVTYTLCAVLLESVGLYLEAIHSSTWRCASSMMTMSKWPTPNRDSPPFVSSIIPIIVGYVQT